MAKRQGVGPVACAIATACACMGVAGTAAAQDARPATASLARSTQAPRIEAFDVEQVRRLAPGVPLVFTVYGSPGAIATLAIGERLREVPMHEAEPGVYEATVTPQERDRITAEMRVVATLRHGDRVVREPLREPLVLGGTVPADPADARRASTGPNTGAAGERVARLEPSSPRGLASEMPVRRGGAPVPVATAHQPPALPFEAAPQPVPVATGPVGAPMALASPVPSVAAPMVLSRGETRSAELACTDCAVVESVRAVDGDDAPQRAGAFASTVTGSVLGERFGEAHGRRITKIWNVLSGRRADADGTTRWDVVLRASDGTTVVRRYDARPPFVVGETVRLGNGSAPARSLDAAWR